MMAFNETVLKRILYVAFAIHLIYPLLTSFFPAYFGMNMTYWRIFYVSSFLLAFLLMWIKYKNGTLMDTRPMFLGLVIGVVLFFIGIAASRLYFEPRAEAEQQLNQNK